MRRPNSTPLPSPHRALPPAPPTIHAQLDRITLFLCEAIQQNLVGIYLHGSLAMGCFNAQRSDIDLLVITRTPIDTDAARTVLVRMLQSSQQPRPVEISIVHYAQITPWRHPTPFDLHFSEMHRAHIEAVLATPGATLPKGGLDADLAAHFTVLLTRGRTLYGAPITSLELVVPWPDYVDAIRRDFEETQTASHLDAVYAVLNACRIWAAVEAELVLSKAGGALWVSARLTESLRGAVQAAAECNVGIDQALFEDAVRALLAWIGARLGWQ